MATKLKVVEDVADIVPAPQIPDFDPATTRKRHAGWTAERQRRFIERLVLTGSAGQACAAAGVASSSAYRLRNKAGAESFARAWDAALVLATTRGTAIAWDRALNGRVARQGRQHRRQGQGPRQGSALQGAIRTRRDQRVESRACAHHWPERRLCRARRHVGHQRHDSQQRGGDERRGPVRR